MIVDTLVLELGMDPAKFTEAQRDALKSLRKFEEEAEAQGKRVEGQTKRLNEVLQNFKRETLSTLGLFVGGYGLKEMIVNISNLDAQTGRFAKTLGVGSRELSNWQGLFKQIGADVGSAQGAIGGLNSAMIQFQLTGQAPGNMLGVLTQLGVDMFDKNRNLKSATDLYLDIASAIEKKGLNPRMAAGLLSHLPGMNQDMINALLLGRKELERYLREANQTGGTTEKTSKDAQEFQKSMGLLGQAATEAGRALLDRLYPALKAIADTMRELITLSPGAAAAIGVIASAVGLGAVGRVAKRILGIGGGAAGAAAASGGRAALIGRGGVLGAGVLGMGAIKSDTDNELRTTLRGWFGIDDPNEPVPDWIRGGGKSSTSGVGVPVKPGSGTVSPAMQRVSEALSGLPDIKQATSFNDPYHAFLGSAHSQGRAMDVTIKDPSKSSDVAEKIRRTLASQGIDATVLDEYKNPSRHSTGGHIHIGIDRSTASGLTGRAFGLGPSGVASGSAQATGDTTTTSVQVGTINVNAPEAKDASGIARAIVPQLQRQVTAGFANTGAE